MVKKILVILDTFPSLSETFLYTTLDILRLEYDLHIYARKRGSAPHTYPWFSTVSYLPSDDLPSLLKAILLVVLFVKNHIKQPAKTVSNVRSIREYTAGDRRKFLQVAYRLLPLFVIDKDLTYIPFGGLAAKYLEYIKIEPVAFSLRGSDINIDPLVNEDYKRRLRAAILSARAIHCVCEDIRSKAETLAGRKLPNARVIYSAINPRFLETGTTKAAQSDRCKIISVGRLDWRKGLEHGMVAMRELVDRGYDFEWQIIGGGEYQILLQWAIRDLKLHDRVNLSGPQNQSEILNQLKQSHIYFHPAVHEGISNAALEAMAIGLPVVVSDVGGMREAIQSGSNGLLVPPRDWRAMVDALEKLIREPELRAMLGAQASRSVQDKFSTQQQIVGFNALFQEAARNQDGFEIRS